MKEDVNRTVRCAISSSPWRRGTRRICTSRPARADAARPRAPRGPRLPAARRGADEGPRLQPDQRGAAGAVRVEPRADFSYGVVGLSRYRVNVYRQRGVWASPSARFLTSPRASRSWASAEICTQLIQRTQGAHPGDRPDGGRGKTTSMAAMLDRINRERDVHIAGRGPARVSLPAPEGAREPAGSGGHVPSRPP